MNPGDVKKTFTDKDGVQQVVVIPAEVFRAARRNKISNGVAIDQYLAELGYKDKTAVEETAKARQPKTRTRKPNDTKRGIMEVLEAAVAGIAENGVEIVNAERQLRFSVDGNVYEVTLVQKRK